MHRHQLLGRPAASVSPRPDRQPVPSWGFAQGGAGGFTLIELLVVVLIISILAAIAVPQYFKVVEKGRLSEALQYCNHLKAAQERYLSKTGQYFSGSAINATSFDVNLGGIAKFSLGNPAATLLPAQWTVVLTRNSPCPALYGCYTLTFQGPNATLTCTDTNCSGDLLPQ